MRIAKGNNYFLISILYLDLETGRKGKERKGKGKERVDEKKGN